MHANQNKPTAVPRSYEQEWLLTNTRKVWKGKPGLHNTTASSFTCTVRFKDHFSVNTVFELEDITCTSLLLTLYFQKNVFTLFEDTMYNVLSWHLSNITTEHQSMLVLFYCNTRSSKSSRIEQEMFSECIKSQRCDRKDKPAPRWWTIQKITYFFW